MTHKTIEKNIIETFYSIIIVVFNLNKTFRTLPSGLLFFLRRMHVLSHSRNNIMMILLKIWTGNTDAWLIRIMSFWRNSLELIK